MGDLDLLEVLTPADLGFSLGPVDLISTVVSGRVMIYALSRNERMITALELTAGGWTVAGSLSLSGSWRIGRMPELTLAGDGKLLVEGLDGDVAITLDADGLPVAQGSFGALLDPVAVSAAGAGLLVSGREDAGGVDVFSTAGGQILWSAEVADTPETYLDRVSDMATFEHGGDTYVIAASASEDGLTLLRRDAGDSLTVAGAVGVAEGLPINDPSALYVFSREDETQILVASRASNSLSVVTLTAEGVISTRDHVLDTTSTFFAAAAEIATATSGDFAFVAVSGSEGGMTLLTLLPNGRLQHVDSLADHTSTTLYRPSGLTMAVLGDTLHLSVASEWDAGMTRLTVDLSALGAVIVAPLGGALLQGTSGDDQIIGSDVTDTLDGGAGDDILFDGSGSDLMKGGSGADLFVFAADGLSDRVLDFEIGIDRLDLSSFGFLYDVSQLQITPTPEGALLIFGDETIELLTSDATPLPSGALATADILDLDRPLLSVAGQNLKGGEGGDTIIGGSSGDTIQGGGGSDEIAGAFGDDVLLGQDGADTMAGGDGADTLSGNAGDDAIRGDLGDDWISGGDGGDLLLGDGAEDWSPDFDWGGV